MEHEVFVSYSRSDLPFVDRLNAFLADLGITTWFDRKSLLPGQKWKDVIDYEIPRSRVFLTCLSAVALDKRGHFQVEQHLASEAALRVPPERLFILPVALGSCEVPRRFRQYHIVNLVEPGSIELLLQALSAALERKILADPGSVERLHSELLRHVEPTDESCQGFVDTFMESETLSFQESMSLIEYIANSEDANRLRSLLKLRACSFLSRAEQVALDRALKNVESGRATEQLSDTVHADEMKSISQIGFSGNLDATGLLQINQYGLFIARKNTEAYLIAEKNIRDLLLENKDSLRYLALGSKL